MKKGLFFLAVWSLISQGRIAFYVSRDGIGLWFPRLAKTKLCVAITWISPTIRSQFHILFLVVLVRPCLSVPFLREKVQRNGRKISQQQQLTRAWWLFNVKMDRRVKKGKIISARDTAVCCQRTTERLNAREGYTINGWHWNTNGDKATDERDPLAHTEENKTSWLRESDTTRY